MPAIPEVFNQPGAGFVLLVEGRKDKPIEKEWQEHPHSYEDACRHRGNVGVVAGNGFVGLDLDDPAAFEGVELPPTTEWQTRPGRFGMWFAADDVAEVLAAEKKKPDFAQFLLYKDGKKCGELKLCRSYQVIPPSYKYVDPATEKTVEPGKARPEFRVDYVLVDSSPPAAIKLSWLVGILKAAGISFTSKLDKNAADLEARGKAARQKAAAAALAEQKGDRERAYCEAALQGEITALRNTSEGERNDRLNKAAFVLGQLIGPGQLDEPEVVSSLRAAARQIGLTAEEAEKTIQSGIEAGKTEPREISSKTPDDPAAKFDEISEEELNAYSLPSGPVFECHLPKEHFIQRYMAYGDDISDAYPEYWFAAGIFSLAVVCDKKLKVELKQETIYPNLYVSINGMSSLARKSTAVNKAEEILLRADSSLLPAMIPTEFSPEAFIEHMSNYNHAPWIRDEAAGILGLMKRDYMRGFKDSLMNLYGNKPFHRKLRTSQRKGAQTEFNVDDPYLNLLWATTGASLAANTDQNDTLSGFMARFMFFFPQGKKKKRMPLEEGTAAVSMFEDVIVDQLAQIAEIKNRDCTTMHFSPEAADYFSRWQIIREAEIESQNNGNLLQIYSRMAPAIVKLSMLFELGMPDFDPYRPIRAEFVAEACRLADTYLMPTATAVYELVGANAEKNRLDKIVEHLKKHGGRAVRREILRATRLTKKEFDEAIDTMVESGEIELREEHPIGAGRPRTWILLNCVNNVYNVSNVNNVNYVTEIPANSSGDTGDTRDISDISDKIDEINSSPPVGGSAPAVASPAADPSATAQDAARNQHFAEKAAAVAANDPGFTKFKEKMSRRACVLCGRHFSYDLTRYDDKDVHGYVCTTCHMQGPPPVPESTKQEKLL